MMTKLQPFIEHPRPRRSRPQDFRRRSVAVEPASSNRYAKLNDQELVDGFRDGDPGAFEELYRRHHGTVLRRLSRICGNAAVAEELTQEAFLRAARSMGSEGEMRFGAWVARIGTNMGIDHIRSLRRLRVQSFDDLLGGDVALLEDRGLQLDSERRMEQAETRRFIATVLSRLKPRHRLALVLRELEGLDYATVAERMGISTSAVETLLFRARGRFREEYAKAMAASD
ncbi:MAG: RNA polymerase sigma factor RpoE [Candidatus Dormibacteria bacterium]